VKYSKSLLIILAIVMVGDLLALNIERPLKSMSDYLLERYPHVHKAIKNDTYYQLQQFDQRLMVGRKINNCSEQRNFSGSILVGAELVATELPCDKIAPFNFSNADLAFANLAMSDLTHADLSNAHAFGADFNHTLIACQNIRGLDLSNASLLKTQIKLHGELKFVTRTILEFCGAVFNEQTIITSPLRYRTRSYQRYEN
jgi:hypothetical protein